MVVNELSFLSWCAHQVFTLTIRLIKTGKVGYGSTVIPNRGAWLELETDSKDIAYTRIDRTRKIPFHNALRALGFSGDVKLLISLVIASWFATLLKKISTKIQQIHVLMKLKNYERLRPGEPKTADSSRSCL